MGGNSGRKANSGRIENFRLTRHFTDALAYATELHAGQARKDTSIPYIARTGDSPPNSTMGESS